MARRAVIDVGSNSVKMIVADVEAGTVRIVDDRVVVTRLAEGLHEGGRIGPEAAERTVAAIRALRSSAVAASADSFAAVGTEALRRASNAAEFVRLVRDETGLDLRVIPGEEEARLSWRAAAWGPDAPRGRRAVFDVGGASTEFVIGDGERIESRVSLGVGVRAPTERFLRGDPPARGEVEAMFRYLEEALAPVPRARVPLVGVGGTVTTLARVMTGGAAAGTETLHGARLPVREMDRQIARYRVLAVADRAAIPGMIAERADVILAGAAIVKTLAERAGVDEIRVSVRGLRHGVLADLASGPPV